MAKNWKILVWKCPKCGREYSYTSYVKARNNTCRCGTKLKLQLS